MHHDQRGWPGLLPSAVELGFDPIMIGPDTIHSFAAYLGNDATARPDRPAIHAPTLCQSRMAGKSGA
jgi:hypothetical protein